MVEEKKDKRVNFRFTEIEYNQLKNKWNKTPFANFSRYLRHLLLEQNRNFEIKYIDKKELENLIFQVGKIGNNINQIAKLANQKKDIEKEKIEELNNKLNEILNIVEKI